MLRDFIEWGDNVHEQMAIETEKLEFYKKNPKDVKEIKALLQKNRFIRRLTTVGLCMQQLRSFKTNKQKNFFLGTEY